MLRVGVLLHLYCRDQERELMSLPASSQPHVFVLFISQRTLEETAACVSLDLF